MKTSKKYFERFKAEFLRWHKELGLMQFGESAKMKDGVQWLIWLASLIVLLVIVLNHCTKENDGEQFNHYTAWIDPNNVYADYSFDLDPNDYIPNAYKSDIFYIGGAEIERFGENRLSCNVSEHEFWERLYNCLSGSLATGEVRIQWAEPNEPYSLESKHTWSNADDSVEGFKNRVCTKCGIHYFDVLYTENSNLGRLVKELYGLTKPVAIKAVVDEWNEPNEPNEGWENNVSWIDPKKGY